MNTDNWHLAGNKSLLDRFNTAFFCSKSAPADIEKTIHKWVSERVNEEVPVISGFHSPAEQMLRNELLTAEQPLIMVLARGMYKRIPDKLLERGLSRGHVLLVSPFQQEVTRVSAKTARKRNELIVEQADEIVVGHARPNGSLSKLFPAMRASRKLLYTFDLPGNEHLANEGFARL